MGLQWRSRQRSAFTSEFVGWILATDSQRKLSQSKLYRKSWVFSGFFSKGKLNRVGNITIVVKLKQSRPTRVKIEKMATTCCKQLISTGVNKVVRPTMNSVVNMLLQHCSTVTTWNNMVDNLFIIGGTTLFTPLDINLLSCNNLCVFSRVSK